MSDKKKCPFCEAIALQRFIEEHHSKPEGIPTELADVIIRVLDYCAYAGIDIENVLEVKHEYNKSRPYRHGGKKC